MLSDSTIYEVRDGGSPCDVNGGEFNPGSARLVPFGTGEAVPKFKSDCWHNPNGGPAHSVPQGERYCEYCGYDTALEDPKPPLRGWAVFRLVAATLLLAVIGIAGVTYFCYVVGAVIQPAIR